MLHLAIVIELTLSQAYKTCLYSIFYLQQNEDLHVDAIWIDSKALKGPFFPSIAVDDSTPFNNPAA